MSMKKYHVVGANTIIELSLPGEKQHDRAVTAVWGQTYRTKNAFKREISSIIPSSVQCTLHVQTKYIITEGNRRIRRQIISPIL